MEQTGKTLVEAMTVVAVLGIATILTAEAFLPAARYNQVQAVRAEVAGELRLARQLAMARRQTMRMRLEPGRSRLAVDAVRGGGAVLRAYDFSNTEVVVGSVSNGPEILFYGSGRAATPTTITLNSAEGDKVYELTVSITGRVTLK